MALETGAVFGRYTIVREIGRGGMGAVYEATHNDLKKRVAIKALDPRLANDPELRARFLREGESAGRIHHPNVVDIYDVGVDQDVTFLVMELLEGEDLGDLLQRSAPLGVQATADILLGVCAALSAAHREQVVHRDLKPGNIFIVRDGHGTFAPKVLDFGISKIVDDRMDGLTSTGAILGTPYYMSPEQAHGGKALDHRTDIYSLGVILYECVAGARPFVADSMYQMLHRIVAGDFAPPRTLCAGLDPTFEALILTAMRSDPDRRFQSVDELGAALLPFASPRTKAMWAPLFDPGAAAAWETQPTMGREAAFADAELLSAPHTINQTRGSVDLRPPGRRNALLVAGVALCVFAAFAFFLAIRAGGDEIVAVPIAPAKPTAPVVAPTAPVVAPTAPVVEPPAPIVEAEKPKPTKKKRIKRNKRTKRKAPKSPRTGANDALILR